MIAFLTGKLAEKTPSVVLLDVNGVGYEVFISLTTYDRLPATGSECRLFIHHHIREDAQLLFGFAQKEERSMFESLLNVNGVGPKSALSVLSGLTVGELSMAIADNNVKRISAVHGIGKKTAERIVIELRDKINPIEALATQSGPTDNPQNAVIRDTLLALESLGFPQDQARKMVQSACAGLTDITDSQTLLRRALNTK